MARHFFFIAGDDNDDTSLGKQINCSTKNDYIGYIENKHFTKNDLIQELFQLSSILEEDPSNDVIDVAEAIHVFSFVLKETGDNGATINYY